MGVGVQWVRKWMYVGGVGFVEQVRQILVLIDCPLMCEGKSSSYGRRTSSDPGDCEETCEEALIPRSRHGGFGFCINMVPIIG